MKTTFLSTLILLGAQLTFAQGLLIDSAAYAAMPKWEASSQGYASTALPSRISFDKYTPYVGNQGQVMTCVGWAVAYAHLTTQQNQRMGITNMYKRSWRVMDPHFVYAFIRDRNDQWCQKGSSMVDAMEVLSTFGCKPKVAEPYISCNSGIVADDLVLAQASPYKIGKWYALKMNVEPVSAVKAALASEYIVSVGMNLTESFQSGTTVYSGKWSPKYGEKYIGGHAMTVVGYDDYKYGGAFQIMNSYGDEFGDDGFVWVSYADFRKTMNQAFIFETPGYRDEGCMYGNCRNSFSIYRSTNGGIYEGYMENSSPNTFGQYIFPDGSMYVGGWNKGRKHGFGLLYDTELGKYFKVAFNNDVLTDSETIQGFTEGGADNKVQDIYETLKETVPGDLLDEQSEAYMEFEKSYQAPIEPIKYD